MTYHESFKPVLDHLASELSTLRSGRATPALVEHVKVEAYGTITPLVELASITAPEPRLLVVSPWDKSIVKDIERALQAANLGMNPTVDGVVIRMSLPQLTEERRRELVKLLKAKLEDAKVSARNVREDILKKLRDQKTKGEVAEDKFFVLQKDLQKSVDEINEQIKQSGEDKEREIMTI